MKEVKRAGSDSFGKILRRREFQQPCGERWGGILRRPADSFAEGFWIQYGNDSD